LRLVCGGRVLELSKPAVMGVLNVTADSFADGGRYRDLDAALTHALAMVGEGAAIIDVGGESTRPGAEPVSEQQELDRVMPVIEALRQRADAVISIDTMKAGVMREAVRAGAGMINDVLALQAPDSLAAAAEGGAAVCLMHMQGNPRTMQDKPAYRDVVVEVEAFLRARVAECIAAGMSADRICVDPGFGFGKSIEHNLQLLAGLATIADGPSPVLVGLSRKSMLGHLTGRSVNQRLPGSLALATIAILRGARIIRTHDVAATVDAVSVAWAASQYQGHG
jgi:dihydropteroate synthase